MKTVPEMLKAAMDQLDDRRRRINEMLPFVQIAVQVADEFNKTMVNPVMSDRPAIEVRYNSGLGYYQILEIDVFTGDMADVLPIRRRLRALGFPAKESQYDSGMSQQKSYRYCNYDCEMSVHLGGKDATCKYVKTGERKVDTYELQCDGAKFENGEVEPDES